MASSERVEPIASDGEVREAVAFLRAHKCRCCGAFITNCMCWANYMTDLNGKSRSSHCTPKDHGRDGYGW